jgi:hypothetical protein
MIEWYVGAFMESPPGVIYLTGIPVTILILAIASAIKQESILEDGSGSLEAGSEYIIAVGMWPLIAFLVMMFVVIPAIFNFLCSGVWIGWFMFLFKRRSSNDN